MPDVWPVRTAKLMHSACTGHVLQMAMAASAVGLSPFFGNHASGFVVAHAASCIHVSGVRLSSVYTRIVMGCPPIEFLHGN